ncbi:hypothetical protein J2W35_003268 [Variovorax boronicumulans]|uniref:hypothetical protein n=1 Tax=Variovorax boronicumulans TaxID=436515 RepID=UPI002785649F|nr:hypothetical protein [Variovorax boronicumulans]MDQ0082909.1 hypothetical protein [Variovorax boronicumulans]
MESEAVLSLPVEGRWLFVIIILSADDVGLFEATEFKLARRADVNRDLAGKLMQMIADADLIRLYMVDGKRYGFVPKFRQRLQIQTSKHPLPPREIYQDDSDALNKINKLATRSTVGAPVGSSLTTDGQPPESELELELEPEKKVSESSTPRRRRKATDPVPSCPFDEIVATYHEVLPELPSVRVMKAGGPRHKAIAEFWRWVLTSTRNDGQRRATTTEQGLAWIRHYFGRASDNDFIMAREPRGAGHENWEADIDYLCSERGMRRVIEKTKERT